MRSGNRSGGCKLSALYMPYDYLMHMLVELQVHPCYIIWIAMALFQGKVVLRCGCLSSEPVTVHPGLLQGSSLSPVLYTIQHLHNYDNRTAARWKRKYFVICR